MDTMISLCKVFDNMHKGYHADYDDIESYDGYHVVYITDNVLYLSSRNVFDSSDDFSAWIHGVVLD